MQDEQLFAEVRTSTSSILFTLLSFLFFLNLANLEMTATCPPFSSSFSPTSFASATHDGSSPSIPVFGRKTGLEGYVDEEGTSMITAAGEGDVEGCQLAWRMRALELGEKSEEGGGEAGAATTSPDTSFPSLSIGTSPHHPVSQSHFLPNAITADDLNTLGAVTQWRAALKEAHKTPTPTAPHSPSLPSLAISPDKLSSPPSLFLLPPSCEHSPHSSLAGGATPLARPEPVKELVSLSSDFNLHHGDVLDPGALPLPDVPTDYVFPDANGRASFSSEPFSPPPYGFGRAEMDTTSTPPPSSPPLPPVKVIPSPPSAFSASSSATGASPLPPLALSASLFPPSLKQKASNPESLIDLYRRDGSRRESFGEEEGDEAQVGEYEDEAARAFEREMETERRVQGEAFGNAASEFAGKYGVELPILLLPASFSANSNCPYCLLPLHDDPQTWADEHWACLPFLLGSTGEEGEKFTAMPRAVLQLGFAPSVSSGVNDVYHAMRRCLHTSDIPNFVYWRLRVDDVLDFVKRVSDGRKATREEITQAVAEFAAVAQRAKEGGYAVTEDLPSPADATIFPTLHHFIVQRCRRDKVSSHTFTWTIVPGVERSETVYVNVLGAETDAGSSSAAAAAAAQAAAQAAYQAELERAHQRLQNALQLLWAACDSDRKRGWFNTFPTIVQQYKDLWTPAEMEVLARRVAGAIPHVKEGRLPKVDALCSNLNAAAPGSSTSNSLGTGSSYHPFSRLSRYPRVFSRAY